MGGSLLCEGSHFYGWNIGFSVKAIYAIGWMLLRESGLVLGSKWGQFSAIVGTFLEAVCNGKSVGI